MIDKSNFFKKTSQLFLIAVICLAALPLKIFAHDAFFIQSALDPKLFRYSVTVQADNPGIRESKHLEHALGDFTAIRSTENDIVPGALIDDGMKYEYGEAVYSDDFTLAVEEEAKKQGNTDEGFIYTFPSKEEAKWFGIGSKNNAEDDDYQRAKEIAETLGASLNGLMSMLNDGRAYNSLEEFLVTAIQIRKSITGGSSGYANVDAGRGNIYKLYYGSNVSETSEYRGKPSDPISNPLSEGFPHADENGNLYLYVVKHIGPKKPKAEDVSRFIYAMPKGYIPIPNVNNGKPFIDKAGELTDAAKDGLDTAWITIHHLTHQANFSYKYHKFSTYSTISQLNITQVEKLITGMLRSVADGLRSFFSLYSMDELIYNSGTRSAGLYEGGLMNENWWFTTLKYHTLFQLVAWSILSLAVVKILIQTNISTINPMLKISMMESAQKILIVGFMLISIIPAVQLLVAFNNAFVDIAASQVDLKSLKTGVSSSNIIVAVIMEFMFFGIDIYMNFVYILRSITLAILIGLAPLFVVSMAFSLKGKGLFDGWVKELIANIYLQAFHAFAFAFIFQIQMGTTRGVEQLAIIFSIIPLTDFFRKMFFGEAGSFVTSQAKDVASKAQTVAMGAGAAGLGALGGAANAGLNKLNTGSFLEGGVAGGMSEATGDFKKTSSDISSKMKETGENQKEGAGKMGASTSDKGELTKEGPLSSKSTSALGSSSLGSALSGISKVTAGGQKALGALKGGANMAMGAITGNDHQFASGVGDLSQGAGEMIGDAATGGMAGGSAVIDWMTEDGQGDISDPGKHMMRNTANPNTGGVTQSIDRNALAKGGVSLSSYDGRNPGSMTVDPSKASLKMKEQSATMAAMLESDCPIAQKAANSMGYEGVTRDLDNKMTFKLNENFYEEQGISKIENNGGLTQVHKISGHTDALNLDNGMRPEHLAKTTMENFSNQSAQTCRANLDKLHNDTGEKLKNTKEGAESNTYMKDSAHSTASRTMDETQEAYKEAAAKKAREEAANKPPKPVIFGADGKPVNQ